MRKIDSVILLALVVIVSAAVPAAANPILKFNSAPAFQRALKKGYIKSTNSKLSVDNSIVHGLVSATGSAANLGQTLTGTWNYHGPDPNWSNSFLTLTMYLPQLNTTGTSGLDDFSFSVIDTSNRVKMWEWSSSVLTPGFDTFSFALSSGAGAGGSTSFSETPGFSLANSSSLQIGYTGVLGGSYPSTPTGGTALWTGTGHLDVVPESGWMEMLGFCSFGLIAVWRARRKTVIRDSLKIVARGS